MGPAAATAATPPAPARSLDRHLGAALALMLASGFAGLGYQVVWTQQSALWLGHEAAAVLAVVAAFFGGLALGALALGPRIDASARPARWYAACEAVIGLWSLALAFLLQPASAWLLALLGDQPAPAWHWGVAFAGTFLLLLPATAAMGATLPAMERVLGGLRREGTPLAALYAGNTFGAVLGVLACAFWLVPGLGLERTAALCALLNLACALTAWTLFTQAPDPTPARARPRAAGPLALLAATGLLGIGYEVLVVRVLSQVAENTVYTFAILLAVYLVGTALGAAGYSRWWAREASRADAPDRLRDPLLRLLALACILGGASLAAAETIRDALLAALGGGMAAALAAEAALALLAFLPPTLVMGALFSHLGTRARMAGIGFGRALGVNTLGAALAPFLFGVWLLPGIGPKHALLLVAAGYLLLSSLRGWSRPAQWATLAVLAALAVGLPSLAIIDLPPGGRLASYAEGALGTVSVVEDAGGVATLHINNRQQEGSSATRFADARQALLPILLHPEPRRALFLGLGTGITAASAARDPGLRVDAVELLPEVIAASERFTRAVSEGAPNPRLRLLNADARRYVSVAPTQYDVIVADNFHPARSGSGALYTVEHFQAVRARLAPGGLFCQWLPLHQLDLDTLRSIVRSFLAAYPNGSALLATNSLETPTVGLIARGDGMPIDPVRARARLAATAMSPGPDAFDIDDDLALFGSFIAGPRALTRFVGDAPLNTDDRPVVVYRAPRITYVPDSLPRDRLVALLRGVELRPDELLAPPRDPAWEARLAAYWKARDRFIEVGRGVKPSGDVRAMLAQVRGPLLDVLRLSPDFRPAYDPLLRMALALSESDPAGARGLLGELRRLQPARPEAGQALRELSAPGS